MAPLRGGRPGKAPRPSGRAVTVVHEDNGQVMTRSFPLARPAHHGSVVLGDLLEALHMMQVMGCPAVELEVHRGVLMQMVSLHR